MPKKEFQPRAAMSTTDWSLVGRASNGDGEVRRAALATMLTRYRPALVLHIRSRFKLDNDAAEEYAQDFIVSKVIEQNLVSRADEKRGRFRTYLLTALDHYTIDRLRRLTQGGFPSFDLKQSLAAGGGDDPQAAFDINWAKQVLHTAVQQMHEECKIRGLLSTWVFLKPAFYRRF